jgi:hypothetical protein
MICLNNPNDAVFNRLIAYLQHDKEFYLFTQFNKIYSKNPSVRFWGETMRIKLKNKEIKSMVDVLLFFRRKFNSGDPAVKTKLALYELFNTQREALTLLIRTTVPTYYMSNPNPYISI